MIVRLYLESSTLQSCHEVLRLAAKDGFVEIEMMRTAHDLAVGECLGFEEPGEEVSLDGHSEQYTHNSHGKAFLHSGRDLHACCRALFIAEEAGPGRCAIAMGSGSHEAVALWPCPFCADS